LLIPLLPLMLSETILATKAQPLTSYLLIYPYCRLAQPMRKMP
jgi:hypothetical protein